MICPRRSFIPRRSSGSPPEDRHHLNGRLSIPRNSTGLAVVSWESSAGDYRIRRLLARSLTAAGIATCEVDVFGPSEARTPAKLADWELQAGRLEAAVDYLRSRPDTRHLSLVLVGGEQAAVAALLVAARRPAHLLAVACCSGEVLRAPVKADALTVPTVLVVPSEHSELLESNEEFFWSLTCASQLALIRGARRHFQEPGTLAACGKVVAQWCTRHIKQRMASPAWCDREAVFAARN